MCVSKAWRELCASHQTRQDQSDIKIHPIRRLFHPSRATHLARTKGIISRMSSPFIPKRIVITAYPKINEAYAEAEAMRAFLGEKGLDVFVGSLYDEGIRQRVKEGEFDLLIAVGGDGSVLRAGHLCAPAKVPILGVNLGRLGFLIQIDRREWRGYFERLLDGEAWIENRMMLRTEHARAGEDLGVSIALNEAVVARGE
ncbi:hypothetical protein FBQ83_16620, partial [Chloroflexi bacterium CFX5]|nr:hypothetical protein [Chloroflexi bacterium CFX5]